MKLLKSRLIPKMVLNVGWPVICNGFWIIPSGVIKDLKQKTQTAGRIIAKKNAIAYEDRSFIKMKLWK